MNKKLLIILAGLVVLGVAYFIFSDKKELDVPVSPTPTSTSIPTTTSSPSKSPITKVPLPSGDGRTSFVGEPVPWHLLLADASCELKGEIKYLDKSTYDNQDARFIYNGIDSPARNVLWTVSPSDSILVGPNIFSNIPIPNGQSLLGISLPQNPISKRYELTAKIQYVRLVDAKGNFVSTGGTFKNF